MDDPNAEAHVCSERGSTTHFILTEAAVEAFGETRIGVNTPRVEAADRQGVEVR